MTNSSGRMSTAHAAGVRMIFPTLLHAMNASTEGVRRIYSERSPEGVN